eukprot:6610184-Prymnesium_polylepis.1
MSTTHHSRLKSLKYTDPRFENACVEFDAKSMAPTYRLLWGIPGRSNAIAIAERLGLQSHVLEECARRPRLTPRPLVRGVRPDVSARCAWCERAARISRRLSAIGRTCAVAARAGCWLRRTWVST